MKLRHYFLLGLLLSFLLANLTLLDHGWRLDTERAIATDQVSIAIPHNPPTLSLTQGVKQTVLGNGLTVLSKEIHTAPVVSVQVWYRVGSRNERPGINGISHQLEHLLFKGTQSRPIQFGRLLSALGSDSNAFTSNDETAYFGTVERSKLGALLTLEADRMQNSINGPEQLASEKRVVISELQGYENSQGYRLNRAVMQAAFPNHAYGLPVGGTKTDVEQFTVEQVQEHYKTYYRPDNATLVATGDFDTAVLLKLTAETFGKIPKAVKPLPVISPFQPTPLPNRIAPKAPIVLRSPGTVPLLNVVYPLPDINHPDVPAIDLMDAILSEGRTSRLYQALVETGLATGFDTDATELIAGGWYSLSAAATADQSLSRVEQVLQQVLEGIRQKPVTPGELSRAKAQFRAGLILGSQDITSQATQLGNNQTVAGDYRFIDRYLAAMERVTPTDIQRVARIYLQPDKKTIGFLEPTQPDGKTSTSFKAGGRMSEQFSPGKPVDPAEVAKYLPPEQPPTISNATTVLPQSFSLPNGLRVLLLRDNSAPTVNLSGHIQAGSLLDSSDKAGVASLTASSLMNGTETQNALALAQRLEDRGASLAFGTNREGVGIGGSALIQDLPLLVETLADVLQHPSFPAKQLELSRQRDLDALKIALDDPEELGRRVLQQTIYPDNHPFHTFPTVGSLQHITREDLVLFHQRYYHPDRIVLSLVGDFEPLQLKALLGRAFGQWPRSGQLPSPNFPVVVLPKTDIVVNKVISGKAESVSYLGNVGISRKDPRFYGAEVLNQILGGDTLSSRLGIEVRDRQGLTYGISSGFVAGEYPGPFLISMQTAPNDAQKAIDSTISILRQLKTQGVTEAEVENAKRSINNSYPVGLASPTSIADAVLSNAVMGLNAEELRQFPDKINAVKPVQVRQVIQDLIQPDRLIIVTAGPESKGA